MKILKNISLKKYNTFGVDAFTDYFAELTNGNEVQEIINFSRDKNLPALILGRGSNILFTKDYHGIIIKLSIPGIFIVDEDSSSVLIEVGGGVKWHSFVEFCVARNLGGVENLSLIPGTAGAAPIQNIGAYGQELKNVFENLNGFYLEDGKWQQFTKDDCKFGYRDSVFKRELKGKFIITKITIRLNKNPEFNLEYGSLMSEVEKLNRKDLSVKDVSDVICSIRKSKLPDPEVIGNAGSFFKNPEISFEKFSELKKEFPGIPGYVQVDSVKLSAGWLIERCGWKGKKVGNTGTHSKQALILVNYGAATGKEILELGETIKNSVNEKFGVLLTEEVNIY